MTKQASAKTKYRRPPGRTTPTKVSGNIDVASSNDSSTYQEYNTRASHVVCNSFVGSVLLIYGIVHDAPTA